MDIIILNDGSARCVYGESINLHALGQTDIRRASHVEPNTDGQWMADLSPVGGPILGSFMDRSQALAAETEWLAKHWLDPSDSQ